MSFRQKMSIAQLQALLGFGSGIAALEPARPKIVMESKPSQPRRVEPSLHTRRWCIKHRKNCCMIHGKHKRGRVIRRQPLPGQPY